MPQYLTGTGGKDGLFVKNKVMQASMCQISCKVGINPDLLMIENVQETI